jgi:hypothetical protein
MPLQPRHNALSAVKGVLAWQAAHFIALCKGLLAHIAVCAYVLGVCIKLQQWQLIYQRLLCWCSAVLLLVVRALCE